MDGEKFTNTSITIKGLLGLIEAKDIAIPEIQRPFLEKRRLLMAQKIRRYYENL